MNIEQLKLKSNPFRLTPSIDSKEIIWAGFPEIKRKIENRIKDQNQGELPWHKTHREHTEADMEEAEEEFP